MNRKMTYNKVVRCLYYLSAAAMIGAAAAAVFFALQLAVWVAYGTDYQWAIPFWAEGLIPFIQKGGYFETISILTYEIVFFALSSVNSYYFCVFLKGESLSDELLGADSLRELRNCGIKVILMTLLSTAVIVFVNVFMDTVPLISVTNSVIYLIEGTVLIVSPLIIRWVVSKLERKIDPCTDDI